MGYQDKKALINSHFESRPSDARPLVSDHTSEFFMHMLNFEPLTPQGTSSPENEDQSLFMHSLPQELSCDHQGRRSERPTLPDQLWALFRGRSYPSFSSPPSLPQKHSFTDFLMAYGLSERFYVLKRLVVAEIILIEDYAVERVALAPGVCFLLVPYDRADQTSRRLSRPLDFSG